MSQSIKIAGVPVKQMKWLKSILPSHSTNHDPVHRANPRCVPSAVSGRNCFLSVTRKECILPRWESELPFTAQADVLQVRRAYASCSGSVLARLTRKDNNSNVKLLWGLRAVNGSQFAEERHGFSCAFGDSRKKLRKKQKISVSNDGFKWAVPWSSNWMSAYLSLA